MFNSVYPSSETKPWLVSISNIMSYKGLSFLGFQEEYDTVAFTVLVSRTLFYRPIHASNCWSLKLPTQASSHALTLLMHPLCLRHKAADLAAFVHKLLAHLGLSCTRSAGVFNYPWYWSLRIQPAAFFFSFSVSFLLNQWKFVPVRNRRKAQTYPGMLELMMAWGRMAKTMC